MDIAFSVPVGVSTRKQYWAHLSWQFLCLFSAPSACRSINIYFLPFLTNQRIMEYFRLQRLLEIILPLSQRRVRLSYSGLCLHKLWIIKGEKSHKIFANIFRCLTTMVSWDLAWTAEMKARMAFSISASVPKVPIPLSSSPIFFLEFVLLLIYLKKRSTLHISLGFHRRAWGISRGSFRIQAGSSKLMTNPGTELFFKYSFYLSCQINFLWWQRRCEDSGDFWC